MASPSPTVVALVGDAAARALCAERLCGGASPTSPNFKLGGRPCRLVGDPGAADPLAPLLAHRPLPDVALLAIDAERGLTIEVRSAAFVLNLLERRIVAVISDGAGDGERFARLAGDCAAYLDRIGVSSSTVVPLAADDPAGTPAWHHGASLADALAAPPLKRPDRPLRVSLDAAAAGADVRRVRGRIECGQLAVGDALLLSPANRAGRLLALSDPESGDAKERAEAGETVDITLDTDVPTSRQLVSHVEQPPVETDVFRARLLWSGVTPLRAGGQYVGRFHGVVHPTTVQSIESVVSTPDFVEQKEPSAVAGDIVECVLRLSEIVALDPFDRCPPTGWLALHDDEGMVAAGAVGMEGYADQRGLITVRATNVSRATAAVSAEARGARNGHRGGVLWLTGLSGAGKSTIAAAAESRLFDKGYQVSVLDGDNLRHGLSADLGFSPEDRAENIRRIGEVGALFARAGVIAITAFISPYRSDRDRARAAYPQAFAEVYVRADLATCEARDPKGLYKKARAGEIPEFTGISAPYEAPESPELVIDTDRADIDASVDVLIDYIEAQFALTPVPPPA